MSDVWGTPPTEDELRKAGAFDTPPTEAELAQAAPRRASAPSYAPTVADAAARGFAQGATSRTSDEMEGAAYALRLSDAEKLAAAMNPMLLQVIGGVRAVQGLANRGAGRMADDYRAGRDLARAKNKVASHDHGVVYGASEIGGGIASSFALPAIGAGVKGAAAAGALYGGANALGGSDADLTKGEVGQALLDTAIGTAVGGVAGPMAYLAGKGLGWAWGKLRPQTTVANKVANEVADKGADAVESTTMNVDDYSKISGQVEQEIPGLKLSPSQYYGSKEAAMAERAAAQRPGSMGKMARMQRERLSAAGDYLDNFVTELAADPKKLGSSDVGSTVSGAIKSHVSALTKARSDAARPLYDKAEKLLGSKKIAPIDEAEAFIAGELEKAVGPFQPSAAPLKHTLDALQQSSKNGFADIKVVRALAEKWGQQSEGTGNLLADLPISQRKYVASRLSEILNRSIDSAAESGQASDTGVIALREAQRVWRDHSQKIDGVATDAVKKILGVADNGAPDEVLSALMRRSGDEIKSVMSVLDNADPVAAKQLKAGAMLSLFRKAGAAPKEGAFGLEPTVNLSPQRLINIIQENGDTVRALLGNDKVAINKLNMTVEAMRRLGSGPAVEGSDTVPKMLFNMADALKAAKDPTLAGMAKDAGKKLAESLAFGEDRAAALFTTRDGINELHKLTVGQLQARSRDEAVRAAGVRAVAAAAERLATMARSLFAEAPRAAASPMPQGAQAQLEVQQ